MERTTGISALVRARSNPAAFAEVFEAHFESVLAYVARRTYDADLALDLTAETFAQAFLKRRRFRGSAEPQAAAWLYAIARAQLAAYFRRSKIERKALKRLEIEVPLLSAESRARIEELANLSELRALVRAELERLSPEQHAALQLRVVDELPYSQVAERLEISEDAARARVARGLRALATALDHTVPAEEAMS